MGKESLESRPRSSNRATFSTDAADADKVRSAVRDAYARTAEGGELAAGFGGVSSGWCDAGGGEDGRDYTATALRAGYSAQDLAAGAGANLGLGCGQPVEFAGLAPGEAVLDLGSGPGLDCFLAAARVGPAGRVVGVDMTPAMVSRARAEAARRAEARASSARGAGGPRLDAEPAPVEFRLGEIESIPARDGEFDCLLSNCVINLSPDKLRVFREAFRVLRPGGRLCVSDVVKATQEQLPEHLRTAEALACWVAGAPSVPDLARAIHAAGFADVSVVPQPESREFIKDWLPGSGAEEWVVSARITARRPRRGEMPPAPPAERAAEADCGPGGCGPGEW